MTFTSVSSLALMLFLVGVTFILLVNLNHMVTNVEKNVEIHVYLKDTPANEIKTLSANIKSFKNVSSVTFIPKNKGLQSFMKNLGDEGEAFKTLKNDNPLNDEFVVKTKNPLDVFTVAKRIVKMPSVEKVSYAKNVIGPLVTTTKLARIVGIVFVISLTFIAIHTVTNTIKITVVARKEEIQLRKLIGATNNFIRFPFFIEGTSIGLLGASIASLVIVFGYYFFYSYFNKYIDIDFIELVSPISLIPISCLLLLLFGSLIGIWGAISSLRRILKV